MSQRALETLEQMFGRGPAPVEPETAPPTRQDDERPRPISAQPTAADQLFRGLARTAALSVLTVMALIGLFLLLRSVRAWHRAGLSFLTEQEWHPEVGIFGISAVLLGTVLIAAVALTIAVPLAFGAAIYISEYAPPRLRRPLISLVDLMAAIPSIVYALWGFFLQARLISLSRWLTTHLGFVPFFRTNRPAGGGAVAAGAYASSTFIAGVVVAFLVVPIICSLMREVFSRAPVAEREAAIALGSSRWGMVRTVVIPYGRGGMIGATMLGMGRALGETVAVFLIISPIFERTIHILEGGGNSISALIALRYNESSQFGLSALMAAGLVLFVLTLVINSFASLVISRSRSGATTEI